MEDALGPIFSALADPTRRAILARLARGEAPVGDLADPHALTAPAISKHLKVLEQAGLVSRRVEAQRRIIALRPQALRQAADWVGQYRHFWEGSLDRLSAMLEDEGRAQSRHSRKEDTDV